MTGYFTGWQVPATPQLIPILTDSLKEKFESEMRTGVHVSDIVLCPRKSAVRRCEPEPLTMTELNFFTSGRAIHDSIQILAERNKDRFEVEKEVTMGKVVAHIDLFDKELHMPIEVKSARVKEMKEPKPHYVSQLKMYMAMTDADVGLILVQLLNHFEGTPFVEFVVHVDRKEREELRSQIAREADWFDVAVTHRQPMSARNVYHDKNLNWLCRSCPVKERCKALEEKK